MFQLNMNGIFGLYENCPWIQKHAPFVTSTICKKNVILHGMVAVIHINLQDRPDYLSKISCRMCSWTFKEILHSISLPNG